MSETQMLAHKRAVDAERRAQAILRKQAQSAPAKAGILRVAAAPRS